MSERTFEPRIDPTHWDAIRDFVRATTDRVDGRVPYPMKAIQPAIAELALWGWQSAGLPLDAEELFDRSVIGYYVQVGCGQLTAAARGNRRSVLLRISEVLTETAPQRLPPLPSSNPSAPYKPKDIVAMVSWARGQSTAERRVNAHLLIVLGLGAGLSAQEIIALRGGDISNHGRQYDVHVRSGRPRTVPILQALADIMPAEQRQPGEYLFRPGRRQPSVNAITNFVNRGYSGGLRPSSQRMRATWIVCHLNARTPLNVLSEAAGLESIDALARFQPFIRPIPDDDARRLLRNARMS